MNLGISTICFGTAAVTIDHLERLRRLEFSQIEIHGSLPGFDYRNRSTLRDTARWFRETALPSPSLHLPFEDDVAAAGPLIRQKALDEIKRCLELADLIPLRYAVLHLGSPGQAFNPLIFDHAYAAIATVQAFAGVSVFLETLRNDIATPARIAEFKTAAQLPNLGICYDTGHGELEGTVDAIHVNDDRNAQDLHLWPFEGERNWPQWIERLAVSAFDGPMILEVRDDNLEKAAGCRSRLRDLMDEAKDSIEEFRLKYKLPTPKREDEE
jgi:sugar phosphate isomerase/epimerase